LEAVEGRHLSHEPVDTAGDVRPERALAPMSNRPADRNPPTLIRSGCKPKAFERNRHQHHEAIRRHTPLGAPHHIGGVAQIVAVADNAVLLNTKWISAKAL